MLVLVKSHKVIFPNIGNFLSKKEIGIYLKNYPRGSLHQKGPRSFYKTKPIFPSKFSLFLTFLNERQCRRLFQWEYVFQILWSKDIIAAFNWNKLLRFCAATTSLLVLIEEQIHQIHYDVDAHYMIQTNGFSTPSSLLLDKQYERSLASLT